MFSRLSILKSVIKKALKGRLKCAIEEGLVCGNNVTAMGGGEFWLRTIFDYITR